MSEGFHVERYAAARRRRREERQAEASPVESNRPHSAAYRAALHLAEGNPFRVQVEPDGTISVTNRERKRDRGRS